MPSNPRVNDIALCIYDKQAGFLVDKATDCIIAIAEFEDFIAFAVGSCDAKGAGDALGVKCTLYCT